MFPGLNKRIVRSSSPTSYYSHSLPSSGPNTVRFLSPRTPPTHLHLSPSAPTPPSAPRPARPGRSSPLQPEPSAARGWAWSGSPALPAALPAALAAALPPAERRASQRPTQRCFGWFFARRRPTQRKGLSWWEKVCWRWRSDSARCSGKHKPQTGCGEAFVDGGWTEKRCVPPPPSATHFHDLCCFSVTHFF